VGWTDNGGSLSVTKAGLSLANGQTYYFTVKSENGVGLQSPASNSDGQLVNADATPPSDTAQVRDGSGADAAWSGSLVQLSANWDASSDAQSGIARYLYAIGTAAGGTNVVGWTDNGDNLSVTKAGLSLAGGQSYYFTVKAENGSGLQSSAVNSDGQTVDATAPFAPGAVNDGAGADIAYVNSTTELSANWTAALDAQSGIARYWYAIGTAAGGTNVVGWTDNGGGLSVTKAGLSLAGGQAYYFTVKAENGAGLLSAVSNSDGQTADTSAPSPPAAVNDGTAADISETWVLTQLSANWTAGTDAQSGIVKYLYAIGTTAGAIDVVGWTDNGLSLSVTKAGLSLTSGQAYYFTVKSENGAGLQSSVLNSDGQLASADVTPPSSVSQVRDGSGADTAWAASQVQLTANWDASSDAQSSIARYWYAIGTSAGGINVVGWTDNSNGLSVTKTGLGLANGQIYYFTVRAENGAGLLGTPVNSNGQTVDTTAPSAPGAVDDGTGADISFTPTNTQLSANWAAAVDAQSGIAKYLYTIGTTAGGTDVVGWTDIGNNTSVTRTGLSLVNGQIYYFTVKAGNGAGMQGAAASSNGQIVDAAVPSAPGAVNDGTGADIDFVPSLDTLSANWAAPAGFSGSSQYLYAIGATAGGTDVLGWTSNGTAASLTRAGLALAEGATYYFAVKVRSGSGADSAVSVSDGQAVDTTSPTAKVEMLSALPLRSGVFTLRLSITEPNPQAAAPALSFTPAGGTAEEIVLVSSSAGVWTGSGFIDSLCSTGTAAFSFLGSDLAGNSGTVITEGGSFVVDTVVSSATGGTVINEDGSSALLPPAAYPEDLRIQISTVPVAITDLPDTRTYDSSGVRAHSLSREFTAKDSNGNAVTLFSKPVTIRISWPDADNDGRVDGDYISENALRFYYLDVLAGKWVPVEGARRNNILNYLEADVTHFSVYAIRIIVSAEPGIGGVKAYPNPCYMEGGNLTISGIPPDAVSPKILIYNSGGDLVRTLRSGDGIDLYNIGTWDGRNSSGSKTASGLYIYLVKTASHGKATGKFAILW
ncbi:MAG: hypothetical protein Q7R35_03895, partial [Elusimicrobiota bacterium]|nr:hypothetical protein [Elusimicrobiota bacterium]